MRVNGQTDMTTKIVAFEILRTRLKTLFQVQTSSKTKEMETFWQFSNSEAFMHKVKATALFWTVETQLSDISIAQFNRLFTIIKSFSWSHNWLNSRSQERRCAHRLGRPRLLKAVLALINKKNNTHSAGHRLVLPVNCVNWPAVLYVTQTSDIEPSIT